MQRTTLTLTLLGLCFADSARAQQGAPANSLARALATFSAADTNKDGKLSAEEIGLASIPRSEFLAQDYDKDGSWSKDEFLVFYRQRLMLVGQKVGSDLEAETARIQAVRKTKAAEQAKLKLPPADATPKTAQSSSSDAHSTLRAEPAAVGGAAANPQAPSATAIEAGLEAALQELEQRAAAGQATRADFQKVHDHLVARARAAANPNGPGDPAVAYGSEAYRKMLQSLERLEKRAAEGLYSREDYQEFRETIIHRARLAASKGATDDKGAAAPTSIEIAAIESGLHNALDALEKRAADGHATREDFQKVRDQMIARARAAANGAAASTPPTSDIYKKMMQVLDRLEKRAAEGGYSREEYQELRDLFIHRAREIQNAKGAEAPGPAEVRKQSAAVQSAPAKPADTTTPPAPTRSTGSADPVPPAQPAPQRPPSSEPKDASKPQRPPPAPETPPKSDAPPDTQRPPHSAPRG